METLQQIGDEMIKIRRKLHQIPEIGFEEYETSNFIKKVLLDYGFEVESIAKTGVIAYKKGDLNNKAIAFRADMDGLKVKEETGVEFCSKNKDMMHACGHDGHMAILLGLAKYLSNHKNLKRDVVLIFQPAEEGPGGAKVIIEEEVLNKYNVEAIFGLHIFPELEEGKIGVRPGPIMAQTGEFDIIIKGKSGHGAMPHTSIDSIYIASQLIMNYQSIISRNIDPIEGSVVTIGKINGGEARNIIANEVRLEGTIRAFKQEVYDTIKGRMKAINEGIEEMFNAEIEMHVKDMYPPVINDENLFDIFRGLLDNDELKIIQPLMLSEDFSYYQREIPGIFFMLGSKNEKLGYVHPLHSCYFNFNEEIFIHGLKTYIKICKKFEITE